MEKLARPALPCVTLPQVLPPQPQQQPQYRAQSPPPVGQHLLSLSATSPSTLPLLTASPRFIARAELIKAARRRHLATDRALYAEYLNHYVAAASTGGGHRPTDAASGSTGDVRHLHITSASLQERKRRAQRAGQDAMVQIDGISLAPHDTATGENVAADTENGLKRQPQDDTNDDGEQPATFEEYQAMLSAAETSVASEDALDDETAGVDAEAAADMRIGQTAAPTDTGELPLSVEAPPASQATPIGSAKPKELSVEPLLITGRSSARHVRSASTSSASSKLAPDNPSVGGIGLGSPLDLKLFPLADSEQDDTPPDDVNGEDQDNMPPSLVKTMSETDDSSLATPHLMPGSRRGSLGVARRSSISQPAEISADEVQDYVRVISRRGSIVADSETPANARLAPLPLTTTVISEELLSSLDMTSLASMQQLSQSYPQARTEMHPASAQPHTESPAAQHHHSLAVFQPAARPATTSILQGPASKHADDGPSSLMIVPTLTAKTLAEARALRSAPVEGPISPTSRTVADVGAPGASSSALPYSTMSDRLQINTRRGATFQHDQHPLSASPSIGRQHDVYSSSVHSARLITGEPDMAFVVNNHQLNVLPSRKSGGGSHAPSSAAEPGLQHVPQIIKGTHKFAVTMPIAGDSATAGYGSATHHSSIPSHIVQPVHTASSIPPKNKQFDMPFMQMLSVKPASRKPVPAIHSVRTAGSDALADAALSPTINNSTLPPAMFFPMMLSDLAPAPTPAIPQPASPTSRKAPTPSAPWAPKPLRPILKRVRQAVQAEPSAEPEPEAAPAPHPATPPAATLPEPEPIVPEKPPEEIFVDDLVDKFSPKSLGASHTQRFTFVNDYTRLMKRHEELTTRNFVNNNLVTLDVYTKKIEAVTDEELMRMIWNLYFYLKQMGKAVILPYSIRQVVTIHAESDEPPEFRHLALGQVFQDQGRDVYRNYKSIIGHCHRITAATSTTSFFNVICAMFGSILFSTVDSVAELNKAAKPKSLLDAVRRGTFKMQNPNDSHDDSGSTLSLNKPAKTLAPPSTIGGPPKAGLGRRMSMAATAVSGLAESNEITEAMTMDANSIFNAEMVVDDIEKHAKDIAALRGTITQVLRLTLSGHEEELSRETRTFRYLVTHFDEIFGAHLPATAASSPPR
ncbi:hypothetical protein RI367_002709 [Sorochytrium milnesiophthora]